MALTIDSGEIQIRQDSKFFEQYDNMSASTIFEAMLKQEPDDIF